MPGCALASATSSATLFAGSDGWAISTSGELPITPIDSKLLSGSYGSFAFSAGLIVKVVFELISSV